jgi:thiosulfate/3-mercaptopyruvate sulfurtransferase
MLKFIKVALLIVFLSSCNKTAPVVNETDIEDAAIKIVKDVGLGKYKLLNTEEFKYMYDNRKDILIVNALPLQEGGYDPYDIVKSIRIPFSLDELEEMTAEQQKQFTDTLGNDKDKVIIFYCAQTAPGNYSHTAALWAKKLGYNNVYRFLGGIKSWIEKKYPLIKHEIKKSS